MELKLLSKLLIERLRHSGLSRIYGQFIFKNQKVKASAARLQSQSTSNNVGENKLSSDDSTCCPTVFFFDLMNGTSLLCNHEVKK